MSEPKIATAADIWQFAKDHEWGESKAVKLPVSGLVVVLRQPTQHYFATRRAFYPKEIRDKIAQCRTNLELDATLTKDDLAIMTPLNGRPLIEDAFVEPKVRQAGEPGEGPYFHPDMLPADDRLFIHNYLRGEVDAAGVSLDSFRGSESGSPSDSSGAGE